LLIITDSSFAVNVNTEQLLLVVPTALQTSPSAHHNWQPAGHITDVPLFEPYRQFPAEGSMKRTFKWLRFKVWMSAVQCSKTDCRWTWTDTNRLLFRRIWTFCGRSCCMRLTVTPGRTWVALDVSRVCDVLSSFSWGCSWPRSWRNCRNNGKYTKTRRHIPDHCQTDNKIT